MKNDEVRDRLAALLRRRTAAQTDAAIDAVLAEALGELDGKLARDLRALGVLPPWDRRRILEKEEEK
jgi:hypothetical protein